MSLMTDKDKKFKNSYEFTYCQHFQASLNTAASGLLHFLPTSILSSVLYFFSTKEMDNEKRIGSLSNETSDYRLCISRVLKYMDI